MIKPAIVAVGYNRPDSMKRLLSSVVQAQYPCDEIDLIISIDESNKSDEVQAIAEQIQWQHGKKIIKRYPERQGLRKHIIQCGNLSETYGAVIILEDDLVVSPSFYHYTYAAVNHYAAEARVAGVSLYSHGWNGYANLEFTPVKNEYDCYFGQYSITWGQCWTSDQWGRFKKWYLAHEDQLPSDNVAMPSGISRWSAQSWGKYYISHMVENDLYYVIPYQAMTTNFTDIGQHNSIADTSHQVALQQGCVSQFRFPDFEEGIKYDVFFERIFEKDIAGIPGKEICVNLNGMKRNLLGKSYLLTMQPLVDTPVATFGLRMRPADSNIDFAVSGDDIFLYRIQDQEMVMTEGNLSLARKIYETYMLSWRFLMETGKFKLIQAVKQKLHRKKRKGK